MRLLEVKLSIIALLALLFAPLLASGTAHANLSPQHLSYMAMEVEHTNYRSSFPFVSAFNYESGSPLEITRADGSSVYSRPGRIVSSYYYLDEDADINDFTYDVSRFYKAKRTRVNLVLHYIGWTRGGLFSVGVDTGYNSEKLDISPSIFLGYTQAVRLSAVQDIAMSLGARVGGGVKESPCLDKFDRAYSCRTLTAWSDSTRVSSTDLAQYINIAYRHRF